MAEGAGSLQIMQKTDRLIEKAFEQNAIGALFDEHFQNASKLREGAESVITRQSSIKAKE